MTHEQWVAQQLLGGGAPDPAVTMGAGPGGASLGAIIRGSRAQQSSSPSRAQLMPEPRDPLADLDPNRAQIVKQKVAEGMPVEQALDLSLQLIPLAPGPTREAAAIEKLRRMSRAMETSVQAGNPGANRLLASQPPSALPAGPGMGAAEEIGPQPGAPPQPSMFGGAPDVMGQTQAPPPAAPQTIDEARAAMPPVAPGPTPEQYDAQLAGQRGEIPFQELIRPAFASGGLAPMSPELMAAFMKYGPGRLREEGRQVIGGTDSVFKERASAARGALGGAAVTAAPLAAVMAPELIAGVLTNPATAAVTSGAVLGGLAAQKYVPGMARRLGASEQQSELAGDVSSYLSDPALLAKGASLAVVTALPKAEVVALLKTIFPPGGARLAVREVVERIRAAAVPRGAKGQLVKTAEDWARSQAAKNVTQVGPAQVVKDLTRLPRAAPEAEQATIAEIVSGLKAVPTSAAARSVIRVRPEDRVTLQPTPGAGAGVQPVDVARATKALSRRLVQQGMSSQAWAPKNPVTVLPPYKPGLPPLAVGNLSPEDWITHRLDTLDPQDIPKFRKWYRELTAAFTAGFGPSDQANKQIAWAVSQQQASPADGLLNVLRVEQLAKGRKPIWWQNPSEKAQKAATALRNAETDEDYLAAMQKVPEVLRPLFPTTRPTGDMREVLDLKPTLQELKPGLARVKIGQVIRGEQIGKGIGKKLSDFGDNVVGKTVRTYMGDDPRGGTPTAIDVWAARDRGHLDTVLHDQIRERYGDALADAFKRDFSAIDDNRYEESLDFYDKVATLLNDRGIDGGGWVGKEVQAVGWTAMQKLMGEVPQNAEHMFRQNTRQVAFELSYGSNSPFEHDYPPLYALPYPVSAAITKEVGAKTVALLADDAGVRNLKVFFGPGGYESYPVQPSGQAEVLAPPERVQDFIDALGYVLNQTEVLASRPLPTGSRSALQVTFDAPESQLDTILSRFWPKLQARLPGAFTGEGSGFSPHIEKGDAAMHIFQPKDPQGWTDETVLLAAINDVATDMGITFNQDRTGRFQADVLNSKNDWSKDYEGKTYLASLVSRGRSDLSERLVSEHGPQVRRWVEEAFDKHAPGAIAAHRAGQSVGGPGQGSAVEEAATPIGPSALAGTTFKGGSP